MLTASISPLVAQETTETLVVTTSRIPTAELNTVGNIAQVSDADILTTAATHPHELAVRVPGAWVSRGSGQEHLTAIRSPVLTGPGSCGAFLVMENSIPTRPAGFCNVNQLFEVPTELATSLEVVRGPSNSMYGSNGLHGTINTLLPAPGSGLHGNYADAGRSGRVRVMAGPNDYLRGIFNFDSGPSDNSFNSGLLLEHDDGYRDDSGHEQAKLYLQNQRELTTGVLSFGFSGSWLDQETAGFITGQDAYKDRDSRYRNDNPEAFRKAHSLRLYAGYTPNNQGEWNTDYRAYFRHSEMEFLQHFIPNQPLEENGQTSGGLAVLATRPVFEDATLTLGVDAELAQGFLEETQEGTVGFLPDRPAGVHYDYSVNSYMMAGYGDLRLPFGSNWEARLGLRAEYLLYDYENNALSGNTKDDGTPCTDGGIAIPCLYNRPADRTDSFLNFSPNAGLLYRFTAETVAFANLTSGFRAPQAAELYRLQAQQDINDIDSERLDSAELGLRHIGSPLALELVGFYMRKDNVIFRDSAGLNVSDGKTRHYGIEANLDWRIADPIYFSAVGSYARQKYDFDRDAGLGETIVSGNYIDTAPQILASARLGYDHRFGVAELEWVHQDPYFLDAANTARYEGHELLNLRLIFDLSAAWQIAFRINNLTDEAYADRADLLSVVEPPSYRYFPGRERELYVELTWNTGES